MARYEEELLAGSEARLWRLIEARTSTTANVEEIDARIWELFGEDWAIMFTDLAGFSRRTARFGIIHFLQTIFEQRRLLLPLVADAGGILVKAEADSFLILFRRADRALACARSMLRACAAFNERRVEEEQVLLCVGLGYGRILRVGDHEIWGAEVNAASKLGEDTAKTGEVLVTDGLRTQVGEIDGVVFEPLDASIPGSRTNHRVRWGA